MSARVMPFGLLILTVALVGGSEVAATPEPSAVTAPPPPQPADDGVDPVTQQEHANAYLTLRGLLADVGQPGTRDAGGSGAGGESPPSPAAGGGSGAPIECPLVSRAPDGAAEAVQAAVDANTSPEAVDPLWQSHYMLSEIYGKGLAWFQMIDGVPHIRYRYDCEELRYDDQWLPVTVSGGAIVPQPRPEQFVPALYDRAVRQLPTPVVRIAPADWMPERWTYVNFRTFFWIDQGQGQWAPVTATASVPGLTVTATATPEALIVHPGDGSAPVRCDGTPRAFRKDYDHFESFRGCKYVYPNSSAMADNGESFPLVVEVVWRGSWTASNGQSGQLGTVTTASETRWLPVAEIQAVIVD